MRKRGRKRRRRLVFEAADSKKRVFSSLGQCLHPFLTPFSSSKNKLMTFYVYKGAQCSFFGYFLNRAAKIEHTEKFFLKKNEKLIFFEKTRLLINDHFPKNCAYSTITSESDCMKYKVKTHLRRTQTRCIF